MTNSFDTVHALTDGQLLTSTERLLAKDHALTAELLLHLGEIDARRLYLERAYPSMFAFCVGELGMSEDASYARITVARAARRFQGLLAYLSEGRVHLTGLRLLAPHLTAENWAAILEEAAGKSKQGIEEIVARLAPKPAVPATMRKLPERRWTELPLSPATLDTSRAVVVPPALVAMPAPPANPSATHEPSATAGASSAKPTTPADPSPVDPATPADPAPVRPAGPAPVRSAGPAPVDPAGPAPVDPAGPRARRPRPHRGPAPTGHPAARGGGVPRPVHREQGDARQAPRSASPLAPPSPGRRPRQDRRSRAGPPPRRHQEEALRRGEEGSASAKESRGRVVAREPWSKRGARATRRGAPTTKRGAPTTRRGAPTTKRGAPTTKRGAPTTKRGAPTTKRGAPTTKRGAPTTKRGAPTTKRGTA